MGPVLIAPRNKPSPPPTTNQSTKFNLETKMKLSTVLALSALAGSASAFAPNTGPAPRSADVSLSATPSDRRAFFGSAASLTAALLTSVTASTTTTQPANAAQQYAESWLSEPTDEFKENEARAMEFKRAELAAKKATNNAIDYVVNVAQTEEELQKGLEDLQRVITRNGGLPSGLSKEDMYKRIRSKKAKGNWPTNVEYAYQQVKLEVAFQQSPNKDKDIGRGGSAIFGE